MIWQRRRRRTLRQQNADLRKYVEELQSDLLKMTEDRNRYFDLLRSHPLPAFRVALESALLADWLEGKQSVTSEDVWVALGRKLPLGRAGQMQVAKYMKPLGWYGTRRRVAGARIRDWIRRA
jgi:hypothetical protein